MPAQETAVRHDARIAARPKFVRDQRATNEIQILTAREGLAAERDLEAAGLNLQRFGLTNIDEHITPLAVAAEIARNLEFDFLEERSLQPDAAAVELKVGALHADCRRRESSVGV